MKFYHNVPILNEIKDQNITSVIYKRTFKLNKCFKKEKNRMYFFRDGSWYEFCCRFLKLDCKEIIQTFLLFIIDANVTAGSKPFVKHKTKYRYIYSDQLPLVEMLKSIIMPELNHYSFTKENPPLFEWIFKVSYRILTRQIWSNGNKRTALIFLTKCLNHYGWYLSYSHSLHGNVTDYWERWSEILAKIVENYQKNKNDEKNYEQFKDQILNGVFINLRYMEPIHEKK